jgi:hypothetical protein
MEMKQSNIIFFLLQKVFSEYNVLERNRAYLTEKEVSINMLKVAVKENQDLNQVKYFKENEGNLECINHRER